MAESLIFMMGEFEAQFPADRNYARNHMWAQAVGDRRFRFGFSTYAVRLLQDVYFLDWMIDEGALLTEKQEIGQIESQKAEASLYAPMAGALERFNAVLLKDPSAINVDKYGTGWLFEMTGDEEPLLTPEDYVSHLESVWTITQRAIKGQLNE